MKTSGTLKAEPEETFKKGLNGTFPRAETKDGTPTDKRPARDEDDDHSQARESRSEM